MPTQVTYQEEQHSSLLPQLQQQQQQQQQLRQASCYPNNMMMPMVMQPSAPANNVTFHPTTTAAPSRIAPTTAATPPVLTLTLGGVNFSLTPTDANSLVAFQGMKPTEVVLNLEAFTGRLCVSMMSAPLSAQAMMVQEEDTSQQQRKPTTSYRQVSPYQQQQQQHIASQQQRNWHYQMSDPALTTNTTVEKRKKSKSASSTSNKTSRKKRKNNDSVGMTKGAIPVTSTPSSSLMGLTQKPVETAIPLTVTQAPHKTCPPSSSTTPLPPSGGTPSAAVIAQQSPEKVQEGTTKEAINGAALQNHASGTSPEDFSQSTTASKKDLVVLESPSQTPVSTKKDEEPCPRWGHTMTAVNNQRVIVYGGQTIDPITNRPKTLNDLHIFDFEKQRWVKSIKFGDEKRQWPRQWHTATYLPTRKLLVCFGGESMNPKSGNVTISHKTMVLDTEIMLWYPPSVSGETPSGRSGHSTTLLEATDELVVFGGVKGSKWLNTVSVLNTSTWAWRTPTLEGTPPQARSYHTATAIASKTANCFRIVIFGGNGKMESFNTVHVLERRDDSWQWIHPTVTGEGPKARTGHSATLLSDGQTICIFGGWDPTIDDYCEASKTEEEVLFQDSFLLNTETWCWRQGPKAELANQKIAEARVGHAAVLNQGSDGTEILVFGGRGKNDSFATGFQTLNVP